MNAHLYAHIVITLFTIAFFCYWVMRICTQIEEMRTAYLDMLKKEIEQVNVCFDKWQETLGVLGDSINLNNEILEVLKNERHD